MGHPTSDATIHSNEDAKSLGAGELIVGPQSKSQSMWHNDILLKFDLSLLPFSETNNYRAANRAALRLFSLASSPSGGIVQATSGSWEEEDITWSTAPKISHALATIGRT